MRIEDTPLAGVKLITPHRFSDERGYFAMTWAANVMADAGLETPMVQRNVSFNAESLTLRGMHYQREPHAEAKLITCLVGSIYDVAIDLRPESSTYLQWYGAELSIDNGSMLYVPRGCAHGYLTLSPNALVEYLVSTYYAPDAAAGVRWDDPLFGIRWPDRPRCINDRDRTYPYHSAPALTPDPPLSSRS